MSKHHEQHTIISEPITENPNIWSEWSVWVPALHTLMDASAGQAVWSLAALQDCSLNKNIPQNSVWLRLTTGFGLELSSNAQNNSTWDTLADHHHHQLLGELSGNRLGLPGLTTQKSQWRIKHWWFQEDLGLFHLNSVSRVWTRFRDWGWQVGRQSNLVFPML